MRCGRDLEQIRQNLRGSGGLVGAEAVRTAAAEVSGRGYIQVQVMMERNGAMWWSSADGMRCADSGAMWWLVGALPGLKWFRLELGWKRLLLLRRTER